MSLTDKDFRRLSSFPEQNPNPVIEVREDGTVNYMNPAAQRIFPDLPSKNLSHPLLSEAVKRINIGKDFNCEVQIDGRIYEQKIYFFKDDRVIRIYSSDVTQFKEVERNLLRLASFPEQNPNPVIEIDGDGMISYFNPATLIHFPDFYGKKMEHAILAPFLEKIAEMRAGTTINFTKTLKVGKHYYDMRMKYMQESGMVRIFYNDITQLKEAEEIIREKNKDITDSINYAKRIQQAILPETSQLTSVFPESFIFYHPKDIVSGDFYWLVTLDNTYLLLACADCTGHGVPGALMSMVGSNLLTSIVIDTSINAPGPALNELDRRLKKALRQEHQTDSRDGMDIAFCSIQLEKRILHYAGANRPLIILRNGELIELDPGKFPIGGPDEVQKSFGDKKLTLEKGDRIYLFTDGITDQFGGPKGKKLMKKNFLKLLVSFTSMPMREQREAIRSHFETWKGSLEQVDDVLVIGIEI